MLMQVELSELLLQRTGNWVSRTALCRPKQKLGLNRKKKTWCSSQVGTERVQKLKLEYWEKIKNIETQNERIFGRNGDNARFG